MTTLLLVVAGFLAGSLVAQTLAVQTGADQEYVLVFTLTALVWMVSSVVFFITQFLPDPRRWANRAATTLLLGVGAVAVAVVVSDWRAFLDPTTASASTSIIAGLTLPNAATVLVQWLIVGTRNRPEQARPMFGRGPEPSA